MMKVQGYEQRCVRLPYRRWYNGCRAGELLLLSLLHNQKVACSDHVVVVVITSSESCALFKSRRRDHVGVTNMGGGIDLRIPPPHH
jgi:hypothetical protein